jgi:hypothetical protein
MRVWDMEITRNMLRYEHYLWPDGRGDEQDARSAWEQPFAPSDGAQVLLVLQKAADALHIEEAGGVHALEELLVRELPHASMTRHDAFMWLYVEYKKRQYAGSDDPLLAS